MHVLQSKAYYTIYVIIGDRILTNDNGFTFIKFVVENSSIDYLDMRVLWLQICRLLDNGKHRH